MPVDRSPPPRYNRGRKRGMFMKKRIMSLLAALAMLFTLLPAGAVTAFAEPQDSIYTSEDGCFKFSVLDGKATIEACEVTEEKLEELGNVVTIPEMITAKGNETGYPVTAIEENAFDPYNEKYATSNCEEILEIKIDAKLRNIGDWAFSECSNLKAIKIPDTVETMGEGVFSYCNSLENVEFSSSMTEVPTLTFSDCYALTNIAFLKNVVSIGREAFINCDHLNDITIPDTVTTIEEGAFANCSGTDNETGKPIGLTNVVLPDSVKTIGKDAFMACSELRSLTLSSGVSSIEKEAFEGCNKLTSVTYNGTQEQWNDLLENHTASGNNPLYQDKNENLIVNIIPPKPAEPDKPTPTPAEPADDSPNVLGTAAIVVAGGLGVAAAGYAAYRVGTELYLKQVLPAGAEIPATRAQLAELVWTDAGKPEPAAPLAEDTPEEVKALTWAEETGLMQAAKKNGEAYTAEDTVSRITVIRTWNKAQELKKAAA